MGRLVAQVPNEDPERLKRVLDAKYRTIGIDKAALDRQAEERRAREAAEWARDEAFAQLSRYHADRVLVERREAERQRRQNLRAVDEFRMSNQLKHTRKEWDLNRPDCKQLDAAARVGDDDPRLGPASLQRFEGEDLSAGDRKAAQAEQARRWWEAQAAHKAAMKAAEAQAEMGAAELIKYQDRVQRGAWAQEARLRGEVDQATEGINGLLAEERRLRERQAAHANQVANIAEMDATFNAPMLNEDPSLAASALSAYRVRPDHFKGTTMAEKQAMVDAQLTQMEDNEARRAARRREEALHARTQDDIRLALVDQARNVRRFQKEQALQAQDFLRDQMVEKMNRDRELAELYRNKVHDKYWLQFGGSHR